jgi:hypothetical protein
MILVKKNPQIVLEVSHEIKGGFIFIKQTKMFVSLPTDKLFDEMTVVCCSGNFIVTCPENSPFMVEIQCVPLICCVVKKRHNVRNAFKYRLYPTRKQETLLNQQIKECRWLYNHFLEQRRDSWNWYGVGLSLYDQIGALPSLKKIRPSLATVYFQTL